MKVINGLVTRYIETDGFARISKQMEQRLQEIDNIAKDRHMPTNKVFFDGVFIGYWEKVSNESKDARKIKLHLPNNSSFYIDSSDNMHVSRNDGYTSSTKKSNIYINGLQIDEWCSANPNKIFSSDDYITYKDDVGNFHIATKQITDPIKIAYLKTFQNFNVNWLYTGEKNNYFSGSVWQGFKLGWEAKTNLENLPGEG